VEVAILYLDKRIRNKMFTLCTWTWTTVFTWPRGIVGVGYLGSYAHAMQLMLWIIWLWAKPWYLGTLKLLLTGCLFPKYCNFIGFDFWPIVNRHGDNLRLFFVEQAYPRNCLQQDSLVWPVDAVLNKFRTIHILFLCKANLGPESQTTHLPTIVVIINTTR
jgi:hypothetical protein